MFRATGNKGFHIVFENGNTISVQFGAGSYCKNYNFSKEIESYVVECEDAEVATWDDNYNWTTKQVFMEVFNHLLSDDVASHVTPDEVAAIIEYISKNKGEL